MKKTKNDVRYGNIIVVNPVSIASIIRSLFSLVPSGLPSNHNLTILHNIIIETVGRQFHCNDDRRRRRKN